MSYFRYSFVYIMASKLNGTLYVGVTTNLVKRVYQHRNHLIEGFTDDYNVVNLVYFETYDDINTAFAREKQLKKWRRSWKIELIQKDNPNWNDLYNQLV